MLRNQIPRTHVVQKLPGPLKVSSRLRFLARAASEALQYPTAVIRDWIRIGFWLALSKSRVIARWVGKHWVRVTS